jgi:hypothetical protein
MTPKKSGGSLMEEKLPQQNSPQPSCRSTYFAHAYGHQRKALAGLAIVEEKPERGTMNNADVLENGLERKWWILFAIGAGTFMSALDGSVVNAVLPVIRQNYGSDVATIQWVVTIYLLVVSGLLLSVGRLGDMRGHKVV